MENGPGISAICQSLLIVVSCYRIQTILCGVSQRPVWSRRRGGNEGKIKGEGQEKEEAQSEGKESLGKKERKIDACVFICRWTVIHSLWP